MKKLTLSEIAGEFEMIDSNTHLFFNKETNEFDWFSDAFEYDEEDAEKFDEECWVHCPSQWDINEYEIMADFANSTPNPHKSQRLSDALSGKGAFRRFKDTLDDVNLTEEWYAFKFLAYVKIACEWCEDNGISYEN